MELNFKKEFKTESKEHPTLSKKIVSTIVKDHIRKATFSPSQLASVKSRAEKIKVKEKKKRK